MPYKCGCSSYDDPVKLKICVKEHKRTMISNLTCKKPQTNYTILYMYLKAAYKM